VKKVIVAVIVIAGLAIAIVTVSIGAHSVKAAPKYDTGVEREYEATTKTFPIPLPGGKSYPATAPPQPVGPIYEKGVGSAFVSFFNHCAWEGAAVAAHSKKDASLQREAVKELLKWNALPEKVSETDNTDSAYRNAVLTPAQHGSFWQMSRDIAAGCNSGFYKKATS
jgi:hypothetical protein